MQTWSMEDFDTSKHKEGYSVMTLNGARHGETCTRSYDKEGKVKHVIDGRYEGTNVYIVKLQHEMGCEKVDEMWLATIDCSGSPYSTGEETSGLVSFNAITT